MCFPVKQCGRLYYLYKCSSKTVCSYSLQTWHQILGHCNQRDVLKLENVVSGMKITDKNNFTCETCILGKQINIRNKEPDVRANSPFELIHIDLAGPIDPVAKDGFRYCMIFADDYSGCLFTYFLRSKSDSVRALNKFLADISPYGKIKTYNQTQKTKLDARSKRGIFVGYDKDSPSYLVFYPDNNRISRHRLVKFIDQFNMLILLLLKMKNYYSTIMTKKKRY